MSGIASTEAAARRGITARLAALGLAVVLAGTLAACSTTTKVTDSNGSTSSGDTGGGALLAPTGPTDNGDPANGIKCETSEQLAYHIHAHLAVYVNGAPRQIPADIGIFDNTCIYWLHTHDTSGIIHIESPDERVYKLGDLFAIWRQPLSADQVGPAKGKVTAWVDGKPYTGDPADIELELHTVIQLDVGSDQPPFQDYNFPEGV